VSILDRLRGHSSAGSSWDDQVDDDAAAHVAALASAWDPEPDEARVAASRAAALGAFAAATSGRVGGIPVAGGRTLPPAGAAPGIRRGGRRPAFILVAAGFLVVMSLGTVLASAPGGPLYDVRVASEELLLPAAPDERSRAQVERLDGRLAEASGAERRGDGGAIEASLHAYARIAAEAAADPPADAATAEQLALRVRAQLEVISRIGVADPALVGARTRAQTAARALLAALGDPGDGSGPGPAGTGDPWSSATPGASGLNAPGTPGGSGSPEATGSQGGPGAPSGPVGSSTPGSSGGPTSSSGPGRTPAPSPAATPAATPRRSGTPSASPGGGSGSGSPGGGDATPAPSGGGGQGGDGPAPTISPGERP
jgi:hypothetical protein